MKFYENLTNSTVKGSSKLDEKLESYGILKFLKILCNLTNSTAKGSSKSDEKLESYGILKFHEILCKFNKQYSERFIKIG